MKDIVKTPERKSRLKRGMSRSVKTSAPVMTTSTIGKFPVEKAPVVLGHYFQKDGLLIMEYKGYSAPISRGQVEKNIDKVERSIGVDMNIWAPKLEVWKYARKAYEDYDEQNE